MMTFMFQRHVLLYFKYPESETLQIILIKIYELFFFFLKVLILLIRDKTSYTGEEVSSEIVKLFQNRSACCSLSFSWPTIKSHLLLQSSSSFGLTVSGFNVADGGSFGSVGAPPDVHMERRQNT